MIVLCASIAWAQASTPEAALEELVTAQKLEDALRHLPVSVEHAMSKLTEEQKAQVSKHLIVSNWLQRRRVELQKSSDGKTWELTYPGSKVSITLAERFISGDGSDALLRLRTLQDDDEERQMLYMVAMHFDENEWRLTEFGHWSMEHEYQSADWVHEFTSEGHNESKAIATLRTFNTALITYCTTYPDVGFPANVQALSGAGEEEQSSQHAGLLDSSFMAVPFIRDGYEFHYTLLDPGSGENTEGKFYLTARPVEYGKTGTRSYFTDQTAVVRATSENREATERDKPLE
jgi:hypothetical protein